MMEHLSTLFYRLLMHSILEEFNFFLFIYFILLKNSARHVVESADPSIHLARVRDLFKGSTRFKAGHGFKSGRKTYILYLRI